MALTALPRFATALLLATAAVLQGQLGHVGAQDACTDFDLACAEVKIYIFSHSVGRCHRHGCPTLPDFGSSI